MMIEFNEYAAYLRKQFNQDESLDFNSYLVEFLSDNDWFGIKPIWKEQKMFVRPNDFESYMKNIEFYFSHKNDAIEDKNELLLSMLENKFPDTKKKLFQFYCEYAFPESIMYNLTSFLLKFLTKEICILNDMDVQELLKIAYKEIPKQYGDILTAFLRWLKSEYITRYMNDYFMSKRQDHSEANGAYDTEEYLELLYFLFNEDYIFENDMYVQAAKSKNYTDTWLFLAVHFICALRNTDIVRIYHPKLTMEPEEVLTQVQNGTFSDEDARLTLYSITWRLNVLPLTPSKTSRHSGISSIKFCVPESVEVHIGTLLALAEAHRLIAQVPDTEPLIRCISDYERITRYMGDEIGALFLESNFRTRSANKSYLQSIDMLTDDILENDDEFNVKGYILAALARSHKGSYGEFASTTSVYLKDAKLSGFTPEFVARELFERGVLSFIPSMLLKMITGGEYNKLPVQKQTKLIQELDLSIKEIEDAVTVSKQIQKQSVNLLNQILSSEPENTKRNKILQILHRIGNGNAISKQDECLCLCSAMKRRCRYPDRTNCIGCEYEISTKSTIYLMISEYNRLLTEYQQATNERQKEKYKVLIRECILPTIDEMLQCVVEQYGQDALQSLEKIIKENTNV